MSHSEYWNSGGFEVAKWSLWLAVFVELTSPEDETNIMWRRYYFESILFCYIYKSYLIGNINYIQ